MSLPTDEIYDALAGNASLVALLTTRPDNGPAIFIEQLPENYAYKGAYIFVRGIGATSAEGLQGAHGRGEERFEFSCRAKAQDGGAATCRAIAEQVRLTLQGSIPGELGMSGSVVSRIPFYAPDLHGGVYTVALDMEIGYYEPTAI